MISLICGIKTKPNKTDKENRCVVTRGKGGWGGQNGLRGADYLMMGRN